MAKFKRKVLGAEFNWREVMGRKFPDVVNEKLKKKISRLNKRGPKIMRESLAEAWAGDYRLAKYSKLAMNMKSEIRDVSMPKAGQGVSLSISEGSMSLSIILSARAMEQDAYYSIMVAQYGRKALPARANDKPYALAIKPEDVNANYLTSGRRKTPRVLKPHYRKKGHVVVFATKVGPALPWYKWIGPFESIVKERIKKEAKKL